MNLRAYVVVGALCMSAQAPVFAHPQRTADTTIEWNAERRSLEITHRMHPDDAVEALRVAGGADFSAGGRIRLFEYLKTRFVLKAAGRIQALNPVGIAVEPDTISIMQTVKLPTAPSDITISDAILRDVYKDERNRVTFVIGPIARSVEFTGADGEKRIAGAG